MDFGTLLMYCGILVVAIIVGKYLVDWYHEIPKRNKLLIAQIKLLALLAEKSGIDKSEIMEVFVKAEIAK